MGGESGRLSGGDQARTEATTDTVCFGGPAVAIGGGDAIRAGRGGGEATRSGRGGGDATRIALGVGEATRMGFGGGDETRSLGTAGFVDLVELGTTVGKVVGRTGGELGGGSLGRLGPEAINMEAIFGSESPVSSIT